MTAPSPNDESLPPASTLWEKSDRTLSGGIVAVRGAVFPQENEVRTAVAVTLRVPAGSFQVVEEDGSCAATLLLGPGEALGISAWLRDAATAADKAGAPLYDWDH